MIGVTVLPMANSYPQSPNSGRFYASADWTESEPRAYPRELRDWQAV